MRRHVAWIGLVVVVALAWGTGCARRRCCNTLRPIASAAGPRLEPELLVVQARRIPAEDSGPDSVLLEMQLVRPPAGRTWSPLAGATPIEGAARRAWWSDAGLPATSEGAEVLSAPSILAVPGEHATLQVGYAERQDPWSGMEMHVTPTIVGDDLHLVLTYRKVEQGSVVGTIPATELQGPAGRVFIVQTSTGP
ncbi:MAG: hypothetical protein H6806_00100 [Planctomycetes bacterium]|nr:hypothetical protein [Planctomycetota bacterium]MCB9826420.1 hypothetical protein [Planctomycetota bacterium]MCB9828146.1 hypothetical protein [Planctomycetota bacterium]MCB9901506.1 hypothetical protein [Planctomycetota bacterium]